jgi:hypothetical protein
MPSSTAGEPDVVVEVGYAVGHDVQRLCKTCGVNVQYPNAVLRQRLWVNNPAALPRNVSTKDVEAIVEQWDHRATFSAYSQDAAAKSEKKTGASFSC